MSSLRLLSSRSLFRQAYQLQSPLLSAQRHFSSASSSSSPHISAGPSSIQTTRRSYATGSVSQQPGSKNFKELGENAKDEVKELGKTIAAGMAGANAQVSQQGSKEGAMDSIKGDVESIASLVQKVPQGAVLWGAAGLLPYAGTSLATVYLSRAAAQAVDLNVSGHEAEIALELLTSVQQLQISYGAVILSFLGAIHWGLEFAKYGGVVGNARYALGVAPVMIGWGSLVMLPIVGPQFALITQWAGFFAAWLVDQRATTWGWTPRWYSTYRFWLTAVVGSSILLTVAGESYFGPNAEAMTQRSEMNKMRGSKSTSNPVGESADLGEFRVEKADDAFVKFSKIDKEQDEKDAKEAKEKEEKEDAELIRKAEEEAGREEREKKAAIGRAQSS